MRYSIARRALFVLSMMGVSGLTTASAQSKILKVIGSDSTPVPFASVVIQGGAASITDERGTLNLGAASNKALTADVRRIGYQRWFGTLDLADTATVITVTLPRLTQNLAGITVTGAAASRALVLSGFYDRWMQRQKGALSATFIGPEEIERRHPQRTSDLLNGVLGVSLTRTPKGGVVAKGIGGTCFMTILLDGNRLCPQQGCHAFAQASQNAPQMTASPAEPGQTGGTLDDIAVDLNRYLDASDVAAIEVYARGGNMPVSLQTSDNACGVIAIWTGSRRP